MPTLNEALSGYPCEQPWKERRTVSVKENGKRYSATFGQPQQSAVYKVDGCVISRDSRCCDKLILYRVRDEYLGILVELKGKDLNHAITQVEATLDHSVFSAHRRAIPRARIVCGNIPRNTGNSRLEKSKIQFLRRYGCDLRTVHTGTVEKIAE